MSKYLHISKNMLSINIIRRNVQMLLLQNSFIFLVYNILSLETFSEVVTSVAIVFFL